MEYSKNICAEVMNLLPSSSFRIKTLSNQTLVDFLLVNIDCHPRSVVPKVLKVCGPIIERT